MKQRHDIVRKALCGEAAAVYPIIFIIESDVFNCYETGLFFFQSSNRSLSMPGDDAHGVKQDENRLPLF